MMIPKPKKYRSKKVLNAAKGQTCTLRLPGICIPGTDSVVACHLPGNKGTATKNHDIMIIFGCAACHFKLDEGKVSAEDQLRALQETLIILLDKGLIKLV